MLLAIDLHKNEHKYVYIMGKGSSCIGSAKKREPETYTVERGQVQNDKGAKS